ncbi:hypothetical protein ACTA71_009376 [Dictyostelium dimigraforme]
MLQFQVITSNLVENNNKEYSILWYPYFQPKPIYFVNKEFVSIWFKFTDDEGLESAIVTVTFTSWVGLQKHKINEANSSIDEDSKQPIATTINISIPDPKLIEELKIGLNYLLLLTTF